MFFRDIIGQEEIKRQLIKNVQENKIAHAQLFCGGEGVGKLPLAIAYARYISCFNPSEKDACGKCANCIKFNNLAHPDLHFIFPVVKKKSSKDVVSDDYIAEWRELIARTPYFNLHTWLEEMGAENQQAQIYVKESNEIIRKLSLKSSQGGYKIIIIWLPERMNQECSNKLLKLLEEPAEQTVFLLVSEEPDMLLTTIQSRTQRINIKGIEEKGIATSAKHFALNSQEINRTETSVEIDERTMREVYLRGFELAIKIGDPQSIMCAYNKIHSIWCSENKALLTEILRDDWGYEGMVVSDWGAVHDECKAVCAGLDLRMPGNPDMVSIIKKGLEEGRITEKEIDIAAERVLKFLLRPIPEDKDYDREKQHEMARDVAKEAICLLRNDRNLLPITSKKYKKICVTGEYAVKPYINGQGSAQVFTEPEYVDCPLECLRRALPDVQIDYFDYLPAKHPERMLWHYFREKMPDIESYDLVLVFTGVQPSMDSENLDRGDNKLAGFIEDVLRNVVIHNPNCVLVLTSGSSTFRSVKAELFPAIVQMWPTGEGAGEAIAGVLSGHVNPSGKLSETFPLRERTDLEYESDGLKLVYKEGFDAVYVR